MDYGPELAGVRPLMAGVDLGICHLETPLAQPDGPYRGYPEFSSPPQVAPALAQTGYDACSTASNHSYDQGASGIERTLDTLDAAGLRHAGTARTPQEADQPTMIEVKSRAGTVRVGFLSYAYGFNGIVAAGKQSWRAHQIDEGRILADAASARQHGADVVVVALHWGQEYQSTPNAEQLTLAPRLIASPDIDLLLGHHAHVVQPLQQINGKWIVYGMGNLLAAQSAQEQPRHEGLLVRFTFTEQTGGRFRVSDAASAPLLITDDAPLRVIDVAATARAGGLPNASPQRLQQAWTRTSAIVNSRNAGVAGLHPLSTP